MSYTNENYLHSDLTGDILKAAHNVYYYFGGSGFLESVYRNALKIELESMGFSVKAEHPITVYYKKEKVGVFYADLVVDDLVIIELKSVETMHPRHEVQLVNYLRSTNIEVGLLINFGDSRQLGKKRKICSNSRKKGVDLR